MSYHVGHYRPYYGPAPVPAPTPSAPPAPAPPPFNNGPGQDSYQPNYDTTQGGNNQGTPVYIPPPGAWASATQPPPGAWTVAYRTPSGALVPAPSPTGSPNPTPYPTPTPDATPYGSPSAPYPTPVPTPSGTPSGYQPQGNVSTAAVDGGGPKELVLKNNDNKPMTVGLFENTGPGMNPNIDDPNNTFTLQPNQTLKLSMPDSWQGRAQKLTGKGNDPATWAEINFEDINGQSKTWYDESLIRGYNGALTISPTNGNGGVAGSSQSILSGAPSGIVTRDSNGNPVIDATEPYSGGVNQAVVNYFNQAVGNQNAYVRNFDHGAVRTSNENSLTVNFFGT